MGQFLIVLTILNRVLEYFLVMVSSQPETDDVDINDSGSHGNVQHLVVSTGLHTPHSNVLDQGYAVMSSVTLFLHLFQHRMIVIKYSSDLTKIFVILKSYFGYSYYLSLFMLIKRLVPMPNKHRDESLTRGSTLFA